jgi:hypothetical protein
MDNVSAPDYLRSAISKYFEKEVSDAVVAEAKEAGKRVEQKVRELMPKIIMSFFDVMSVTWDSKTTLCIRVEIKEPKTNA